MGLINRKQKYKKMDFPIEEEEEDVEEEEVEEEKTKEENVDLWSVQEVSTQTQPVIYNKSTKKSYDLHSAMVEILNKLE